MEINSEVLFEMISDGAYVTDTHRRIIKWNHGAREITGFDLASVKGSKCMDNVLNHIDADGNSLCKGACPLKQTIIDGKTREANYFLHHKDGHRVPVKILTAPVTDSEGNITGGIEVFSDMSDTKVLKQRMKELENLAIIDRLTELPNRNYIEPEFKSRIEEIQRYGTNFGLAILDIDFFKKFNDTYGHDVGDLVLKTVSETLKNSARPFDIIGRWGGEEFLAIFRNVDNEKDLHTICERIRILVENSFIIHNDKTLNATISIGSTIVTAMDTEQSSLKRADLALYKSKDSGRNMVSIELFQDKTA